MRLNSSFESLNAEEFTNVSPESPDPSLNSDVFVVEKPHVVETSSITSSDIAEFVRQATEDDAERISNLLVAH